MIAWRLVKAKYAGRPLSTDGARTYGGRWNPRGLPVLYCADSLALAALETLVHIQGRIVKARYAAFAIDVPDGPVEALPLDDLPPTWRTLPCDPATQELAARWIQAGAALALSAPSVIVPRERNIVLNALHPDFPKVRVAECFAFEFDPRLDAARR